MLCDLEAFAALVAGLFSLQLLPNIYSVYLNWEAFASHQVWETIYLSEKEESTNIFPLNPLHHLYYLPNKYPSTPIQRCNTRNPPKPLLLKFPRPLDYPFSPVHSAPRSFASHRISLPHIKTHCAAAGTL